MHIENFTDYGFWYLVAVTAPTFFASVFVAALLSMIFRGGKK